MPVGVVEKPVPVLFEAPSECCGCGACAARCPAGAIDMVEDEFGFRFPRIRGDACARCGLCRRVCGFQRRLAARTEGPWYAACSRGGEPASASGGAFAVLARAVLASGGVVYGAAYEVAAGGLRVRHRRVDCEAELPALQGSKYVQSDATACYPQVERDLRAGVRVLFSGTPCQVAGLKGFLRRDYTGLLTVDLVCHGVPSEAMLRAYAKELGRRYGANVSDARFRCKRDGWDASKVLQVRFVDNRVPGLLLPSDRSSYYDLFMNVKTLRESCYSCPFAGPNRPGDLTIGDFWGVQVRRSDLLEENDGPFNLADGVSCLLANSEAGREALSELGCGLVLSPVEFEDIAAGNDQLRAPAKMPSDRRDYLDAFRTGGWPAVERLWRRRTLPGRIKRAISSHIPVSIKNAAKRFLKR